MPKYYSKIFIYALLVVLIAGCGTRVRAYKKKVERVDQEIKGNQGYLFGTPPPLDRSDVPTTRTTLVVEFEQPGPGDPQEVDQAVAEMEQSINQTRQRIKTYKTPPPPAAPRAPSRAIDVRAPIPKQEVTGYTEYTIEKNDTLQKISKKFYDTYRKWPKIYEANKNVIKDPNKVKPGTVILIPQE